MMRSWLRRVTVSWDLGAARLRERRSGLLIGVLQLPLRPMLTVLSRPTWEGTENLHQAGGAVVCGNHLGPFDALAYGHLLHASGVAPRFLAKDSLFHTPGLGRMLHATGQIPVLRGSPCSESALAAARTCLLRGQMLMVFPEGTYSRDPQSWPMQARLGAARLSLSTGAPLIPVACWGSHLLWPPGSRLPRPASRVALRVGEPMFPQRKDCETEHDVAVRVTDELMDQITSMLSELRQEQPPAQRHDPRLDPHRPEEGRKEQR